MEKERNSRINSFLNSEETENAGFYCHFKFFKKTVILINNKH